VNLRDNTVTNGLLADIQANALPPSGVFWVKGGAHGSSYPFVPADPGLVGIYPGTDDHPGASDSDHQVAEAYVATIINAIARSKYWKDSVIILTWDDSGGMYDHYAPQKFGAPCPNDASGYFAGMPCGEGLRLPFLLISPFAKTGAVVHEPSDPGSIAKFIEDVFELPTLSSLPDEAAGVAAGLAPADSNPYTGDLMNALDFDKLMSNAPAVSPYIPAPSVPPAMNCASLGLTPVTSPASLPAGFETAGWYEDHSPPALRRRFARRHRDTGD
jgi:phospholipase C